MIKVLKKPKSLKDIQGLQKRMDKIVEERCDVRKQDLVDIALSCTTEIHEWAMELPKDLNFKTWAPKTYNKDAEYKEFVDILCFLCKIANVRGLDIKEIDVTRFAEDIRELALELNVIVSYIPFNDASQLQDNLDSAIECYLTIAKERGLSIEDICNHYWEKYLYNLKRFC